MKILEKIREKINDNYEKEGVTIAFLGDSVTQGCFEIHKDENGRTEPRFSKTDSYEAAFYAMMAVLFPSVPINIINAGVSGDNACHGLKRVQRDIIRHEPDLAIVCYGLNDCSENEDSKKVYAEALDGIFKKLNESGIETIFMTPNMLNTRVSIHVTDENFRAVAARTAKLQNSGIFDSHIRAAKLKAEKNGVTVCDCYDIWKKLSECGADTTELLANRINHPTKEMNKIFAYELIKTILYS